jgi:PERQ amino acid-rich with GYF domain-containing protein
MFTQFRSRRDGRSSNGTLTFRRTSATPQSMSQSNAVPDSAPASASADMTFASQTPTSLPDSGAARYTKEQLLELFRGSRGPQGNISNLFMEGWNPGAGQVNGGAARGWGKPHEYHTGPESDLCWNPSADAKPLNLQEMTEDEREVSLGN